MPVLPIDSGRYGSREMMEIFSEKGKLQRHLKVEAALAWAHSKVGNISIEDGKRIESRATTDYVKLIRVKEIEEKVRHDVMAVVIALSEVCGTSGAYVHLGATSSDIKDTTTALQLKDAVGLIRKKLDLLEELLIQLARENKNTLIMARTHGQHAIPMTLGFKFIGWLREIARHLERLQEYSKRFLVGKMSGAVGTQAGLGSKAVQIQKLTMKKLKLKAIDVSTQIVPRDVYAEFVCLCAYIASSLEKFATEIRELQRPEIAELAEPFDVESQIGSSTMPHKKNPIVCERICGLARILRSLTLPALENIPTWHERDLTQSSAERFILPEACILLEHMLSLIIKVLKGLHINKERMRTNIGISQGRVMAESVMLTLVKKGMGRQEAHSLVRDLSLKSECEDQPFKETLLNNVSVMNILSKKDLDEALDPTNYLGTILEQIDTMIEKTEKERKKRHQK